MEIRIANLKNESLFENITTLDQIRRSLIENDSEVVCIAHVDSLAVGMTLKNSNVRCATGLPLK